MNQHHFKLSVIDTDSIMFSKEDGASFSEEEQDSLLKEINSLLPEKIRMAHDGYYPRVLVLKSKNYLLDDGKKIKIKGSALKATTKEKALKEFIERTLKCLLEERPDDILPLYHEYVKEIINLKDISRWLTKKTITSKVLDAQRANEQKVQDAMDDDMVEGDKIYLYFANDDSLKREDQWSGDHSVDRMLEKLYKTLLTFSTILDMTKYPNYKLKKNKKLLEAL